MFLRRPEAIWPPVPIGLSMCTRPNMGLGSIWRRPCFQRWAERFSVILVWPPRPNSRSGSRRVSRRSTPTRLCTVGRTLTWNLKSVNLLLGLSTRKKHQSGGTTLSDGQHAGRCGQVDDIGALTVTNVGLAYSYNRLNPTLSLSASLYSEGHSQGFPSNDRGGNGS